MADKQDDSTVPKGLAKAGPTEMARALTRIADAVGMGSGIHLCEGVPGAVELLVATHKDLRRELEVRRPRDEEVNAALDRIRLTVGAGPEADAAEIASEVWREDRDQERRRLWVHVAEKALGPTPAGGHRDGTKAVLDAGQVLAGFDAAFPDESRTPRALYVEGVVDLAEILIRDGWITADAGRSVLEDMKITLPGKP